MRSYAFKMKIKPGNADEYKRRHDEIWPELKTLLSNSGIRDYYIYLDLESSTLFAFQHLEDGSREALLPDHPIVKKWWRYMADIMETNPDSSPVSVPLLEVFDLKGD
jgi:L-rhamnose mutarotase